MKTEKIFYRRYPSYFGGLFLGIAIAVIWVNLRTAFAPDFPEEKDIYPPLEISPRSAVVMSYEQNPEKHLAYGFPSVLYVGRELSSNSVEPLLKLDYSELVEQKISLDSFAAEGKYEIRMALYSCPMPGAAHCWKKIITVPVLVRPGSNAGADIRINLLGKTYPEKK